MKSLTTFESASTMRPWRAIVEALKGSHQDYTTGSLNRAIVLLTIPMVLEMILESLFAVVDVFWVAHIGANAVATVGLTESLLSLIFAVGVGLSVSTSAMVARRIGERDADAAGIASVQAVFLGLLVSLAIGIPSYRYAPRLLAAMGAPPEIIKAGTGYAKITLGGCGAILMLFLNNAILRSAGDAATAMRILWAANIANLVLDPCLIFGIGGHLKLGITGAAVATFTGRSLSVAYQFYRLLKGTGRFQVRISHIRLHFGILWRLFRVSITGILQFVIANTSWIAIVRIISYYGPKALAGYTIAIRILIFVILPSWGVSNAAATLVGQNLGAHRPDRAEQAVWRTALYNITCLGFIGIILIVCAPSIVRCFAADVAVIGVAVSALRIFSYGNISYGFRMVMLHAFNGAGDTITPSVLSFLGFWLFQVPLAWLLALHTRMHIQGAFLAVIISESCIAFVSMLLFHRGGWKVQRI
jgi:putative MATE family efflux protein